MLLPSTDFFDELQRLEDERDPIGAQDRRDAKRYRWIRENISADFEWYLFGVHGQGGEGMDDAIDAAILKSPNVEVKGCANAGLSNGEMNDDNN